MNRKTKTTISALAMGLTLAGLGTSALQAAEATRSFQQPFPAGGEVRLGNLAGHLELVRGQGPGVVVDATVHADFGNAAETQRLLQGMKWVKSRDKKGREEWVLSYPVEKYRSYTYPISNEDSGIPSWLSFLNLGSNTNTTYRGERVRIYTNKGASAPTLYADLRITVPAARTWPCATRSARCAGVTSKAPWRSTPAAVTSRSPPAPANWGSTPARAR